MKNSYLCPKSELRQFLDAHNITIDLSKHFLSYAGNKYDIEFGSCPKSNTKEFCCWSVGRKFYYDFSICGFLSIWDISPYGGLVHARPEVLMNLDKIGLLIVIVLHNESPPSAFAEMESSRHAKPYHRCEGIPKDYSISAAPHFR